MTPLLAGPAFLAGPRGVLAAGLASLAALFFVDGRRLADPDLFVCLYAGEQIARHAGPPGVETVSFSAPGHPWIDYEWLGRFVLFEVHRRLGSGGLVALRLAIAMGILSAVYAAARRHARGQGPFVLAVLALAPALRFFLFRPALFTFLFFTAWLVAIDRAREGARWPLAVLPATIPLWVNLHGGFILGIVLLGVWLAEALLERFWEPISAGRVPRARPGVVAVALVAAWMLTGLNPFGWGIWGMILETLGGGGIGYISEWRPLHEFPFATHAPTYGLMAAVVLVLVAARRSLRAYDVLLAGGLLVACFLRVRFVAFFSLAAAIGLAKLLPRAAPPWALRSRVAALAARNWARPAMIGILAALVAAVAASRGHADLSIRVDPWYAPVAAVRFLEANGIVGPMNLLNEYDWGGYVRWRLPEVRIFVDGRWDTAYPGSVIRDWAGFVGAQPGYEEVPERYGATAILLRRAHPVVARLERDERWLNAYVDEHAAFFLLRAPENGPWLDRLSGGSAVNPGTKPEDLRLGARGSSRVAHPAAPM